MESRSGSKVNTKLIEAADRYPPANPALTSIDKDYLKKLKRLGYTEEEIISVADRAGFKITKEFFNKRDSFMMA